MTKFQTVSLQLRRRSRRAVRLSQGGNPALAAECVAELVDALALVGIHLDTNDLPLDQPNVLIDRVITACRNAVAGQQLYRRPEPASGPIMMSLGEDAVDAFFDMLGR